jgi:UDP-N-acetylmuramoyl-tripeptide--D-alanyl-D-alanine ligase
LFKYSKNSCFSKSDDDKINDILFENSSSCITRNMINYNDIINNYEINASKTSFDIYNTKYSINIPVTKKWLSNLCLVLFIYKSIFNKMPENNIFNNISFGSRRWNEKIITKNNKNIKIIDDTYNSSYEAVMEGVTRLLLYKETKLIIIGEILELGKFSIEIHKKLIDDLKKNFCTNIDFIFVGNIFDKINIKNKDSKIFNNKNELIDDFKLNQNKYFSYDIIYAKGSRGVGLDEFINEILK